MDSLSWRYEDVKNEKLFADKLVIIPSKFVNYESWRRILRPYILEDLRASLLEAFKKNCHTISRSRIQFSDRSLASTTGRSVVDLEFQIVNDANNHEDLCGSLNVLIK